jgi:hypothetical protein
MHTRHPLRPSPALPASMEWEELPSLPGFLLRRQVPQASYAIANELVQQAQARLRSAPTVAPVWIETMPAIFADTHISGLASREIVEPDVFRHFFGAGAVR